MGSLLRKHVLETLPNREIDLGRLADGDPPEEEPVVEDVTDSKEEKKETVKKAKKEWPTRDTDEPWILTDRNNKLEKWQEQTAEEYYYSELTIPPSPHVRPVLIIPFFPSEMNRVMPEGTWELY